MSHLPADFHRKLEGVVCAVPEQDMTGDAAWIWTHCRALGMTRRSDSGLLRDDVALYTVELHSEIQRLRADAERYQWLRGRVPGGTYRIMGVIYSEGHAGVDAAIDAAMKQAGE